MTKILTVTRFVRFFHITHKIGKAALSNYLVLSYILLSATIFYFANRSFNSFVEGQAIKMESAAYEIETEFVKNFDNLEFVMTDINRKISASAATQNSINDILKSANYAALKNQEVYSMLSSGTFFWIDQNRQLVISSEYGILPAPINVATRSYLAETEQSPWKIFLGEPTIGAASSQYVVPVGVGVSDAKGKYLGTLAAGLRVENLLKKFINIATPYQTQFAIFDNKGRLIVESRTALFSKDVRVVNSLKNYKQVTGNQILLDHFKFAPSAKYVISRDFTKYPFTVLVAKNNGVITREALLQEVVPHFIEWLIVSIFFVSLSYFIRTSLKK